MLTINETTTWALNAAGMVYHEAEKEMVMAQSEIGPALRNERNRQHLSLDEVAQGTRISQRFLQAIESGDMASLPGIVFARNFVRQYAVYLKLDPEPLLAGMPRFDIDSAPLPNPPAKVTESRWTMTPATSAAVWCLLAAGAAAGGWWYFERPRTPVPVSAAAPLAEQRIVPPQPTTPPAAEPAEVSNTAPDPAQGLAESTPVAEGSMQQAAVPAVQASTDRSRPVQVVLTARESSWVQVTADGRTAFVGMLNANDSRSIGADSLVKVIAGNAGGLQISLNGKPLEPIGQAGQVRTVRLTAEGPQFVQKIRPEPDPL